MPGYLGVSAGIASTPPGGPIDPGNGDPHFQRLREGTLAGLAAARAQGRVGGRPVVMDPDKIAAATARRTKGESPTQIAKALGVSRASIYRHLAPADQQ